MRKALFFFAALTVILNSCLDNPTNDKNKLHGVAATLNKAQTGEIIFITDDSIKMHPSEAVTAVDSLLGSRFFVDFRLLQQSEKDFYIEVANLQRMKVDSVRLGKYEEMDAPVIPQIAWVSGRYVNFLLNVRGGQIALHDFRMYDRSKDGKANFILRHDPKNDPTQYMARAAVSFDLKNYIDTMTTDSMTIALTLNIENAGPTTSNITVYKK